MDGAILRCQSLKRIICVICKRLPKIPVKLPDPFEEGNEDHQELVGQRMDLSLDGEGQIRVSKDYSQYCHHPYCYQIRAWTLD